MWRALVFIGLLCLAAFAAVWLADRPGDVLITWGGYRIETTVAVAAVMAIALGMALALLWAAVRFLLRLPSRMSFASRARRRARGYSAVSRANEAVLEARSAEGDWRGALALVERRASLGLLDKATAKRQRAVLLTADALARAEHDESGALQSAQEAVKLAPDLVPAAALAGRLLSRRGDLRRAARIIEAAWKATPHPELAAVYLNLRPGDSAKDRLRRAETLAKLSMWAPEARLALARVAIEAREFGRARDALQPLLAERPTMRACLLMADLEQAEHGAAGRVREWLARAAHAGRDGGWIADGLVSDRW